MLLNILGPRLAQNEMHSEFSGIQGSLGSWWENTLKRSQSQIWELKFGKRRQL